MIVIFECSNELAFQYEAEDMDKAWEEFEEETGNQYKVVRLEFYGY